jgi:Ca-activated chloride channel family protein
VNPGVGTIEFAAPAYLWLLGVPALLLVLWGWRTLRRILDLRRLTTRRVSPVRDRWSVMGDLPLWLCVVLAAAALVFALARPRGLAPRFSRAGLDIVVLQDGSASMYVRDMASGGSRWARSMQFLRRVGDALRWEGDRLALTVFARLATPQVRLTHDPTTVFFFLDHLAERPPFGLDDETTWDTNLEQAVAWGLRVLRKDKEIIGPSPNVPAFLLISDGETWSGEVSRAIDQLRRASVPLFVVGVGTTGGGRMPPMPFPDDGDGPPAVSHLDRRGLQRIATEGQGLYFELDRERPDRDIANAIIDANRRLAPPREEQAALTDLHWPFLAGACGLVALGSLFAQRRSALWLLLTGTVVALGVALRVFG